MVDPTFKDGPVRPGRTKLAQVMTGEDLERVLRRISHEILETHPSGEGLVLVGIHTRGANLAHTLGQTISALAERDVPVGVLDIGLYRDDRELKTNIPQRKTSIPVDITGRHVVVVDDVLYTGRTVRAGLDALTDIGRAETTELAVLIDRGHRELPIRADYVGKNIPTSRDEVVRVRLAAVDGTSGVFLEKEQAA
jgi:pyrimidine operon attenuation protein/uracil phosphoribosyltransferase